MITMTQAERSFIAYLEPGQKIAYMNRSGEACTAWRGPGETQPWWLHLVHEDSGVQKKWFGTAALLILGIPSSDRMPISHALEQLILHPGRCAQEPPTQLAALIFWEKRPRRTHSGLAYGNPVWIPVGHTLVHLEPKHAKVPK